MADVADLAGAYEVGERAEGLVEVDGRVVAVHLVEVDVIGAEPAQRRPAGVPDAATAEVRTAR